MQQLLVRYSQEVGKYVAFIGAGVIFYHAQSFFRVGVRLFKYNAFGCVMVYGCVVYLLFYMFLFLDSCLFFFLKRCFCMQSDT